MNAPVRRHRVQLAVIGAGLAGCAASLFARERGLETAQVGSSGALAYTSGYLDLLGVLDGRILDDPWAGLERLRHAAPEHPLGRIDDATIRAAFDAFTTTLSAWGVGYTPPGDRNLRALTPAGVAKPTLCLPRTMAAGCRALADGVPTLLVDFHGLEGFSARQIQANLGSRWPALRCVRIPFPGEEGGGVLYPEAMARALEVPARRQRLARQLREIGNGTACIGLPAILGIHRPDRVHQALQQAVGAELFEIPTMPPGVAGIRLRELFEQALPARGLTLIPQQKVERLELAPDALRLHLHDSYGPVEIAADAVILATGRFLSGGLRAGRERIREVLLDLPVEQPEGRDHWHRAEYLDTAGHPVNRAGIRCDAQQRPLGRDGRPLDPRLFAAGSLLAGQDWALQRCGAGLALATARVAVAAAARHLGRDRAPFSPPAAG